MITVKDVMDDLKERDSYEVINLWREYCEENNYYDNEVYSMDEFDEMFDGMKPLDIAMRVHFGDFSPNYEWFAFNGYGNLESFNYLDDSNSPIDFESLAEWLIESRPEEVGADEEEDIEEEDI